LCGGSWTSRASEVKPDGAQRAATRAGAQDIATAADSLAEAQGELGARTRDLAQQRSRDAAGTRRTADGRNGPLPFQTTERAQEIIACAPHAIDVVAARHGQTLRYYGLPFARLRRVLDRDRVWFGIEGSRRRLLDEYYREDWKKLLLDLEEHRNPNASDRRHWLYRAAGEAWLESILRRDISKLDPGLIVAPLHAQFRTSHGGAFGASGARPIDLLALRHDGRLVVIELKVNEDREHVFQGVDYWRRVEAHRRRGHISAAKLFGDREISDESPLVYLVAPTLRFHSSFATLAKTIAPDVEIYRFDINEDWRRGVRVVRRERVNA